MRRHVALAPEPCSLRHSKTVLLVNNHKAQTAELHRILQHRMGAYQYIHTTVLKTLEYGLTTLALNAAGKKFGMQAKPVNVTADVGKMLF